MNKLAKDIDTAAKLLKIVNAIAPCEYCKKDTIETNHIVLFRACSESKKAIVKPKGITPITNAHYSIFCNEKCLRRHVRTFILRQE